MSEAADPGRRAAGQAAVYVTASVVAKGLAFAAVPLLATLLGPAEFGVWGVASAASNLVTLVLLFGLYTPVSRLYFEETDARRRREVFFSLYVFQILAGAATTVALDRGLVHLGYRALAPEALRAALGAGYLTSLNLIPLSLMRVREQARRHALFSLLAAVASAAVPLVFVFWRGRQATAALQGLFAGALAMAVLYTISALPEFAPVLRVRRVAQILGHSVQFIPHTVGTWALNLSDRVIVERLAGAAAAGIYTAGYSLASAFMVVVEAAGNSWLTLFLKLEMQERDRAAVRRYARLFVAASAWAGLAVVLGMPLLVRWTLPPEYATAELVVVVAGLGFTFLAPYLVLVYAVMSAPRFTVFPVATLVSAALNIAATVLLVPRIGVLGAALSSVLGYAALALLAAAVAQRVWPIAHDFRAWTGAILATFILGLAPAWLGPQPVAVEIAVRAVLLAGWAGLAVVLGGIRNEDLVLAAPMASAIWARLRRG